jgi:hypothetical protein
MGTSVAQIDATFGHLVPDNDDYLGDCSACRSFGTFRLGARVARRIFEMGDGA